MSFSVSMALSAAPLALAAAISAAEEGIIRTASELIIGSGAAAS